MSGSACVCDGVCICECLGVRVSVTPCVFVSAGGSGSACICEGACICECVCPLSALTRLSRSRARAHTHTHSHSTENNNTELLAQAKTGHA